MRTISRLFLYLVYFFQAETKALREEAYQAAKVYYAVRPLRSKKNPFPSVIEYQQRREDFQRYQRAYINTRCSLIAKQKIALKHQR